LYVLIFICLSEVTGITSSACVAIVDQFAKHKIHQGLFKLATLSGKATGLDICSAV
jgi:hypothetical protein